MYPKIDRLLYNTILFGIKRVKTHIFQKIIINKLVIIMLFLAVPKF